MRALIGFEMEQGRGYLWNSRTKEKYDLFIIENVPEIQEIVEELSEATKGTATRNRDE